MITAHSKKNNNLLLKSLIESDFLLLNQKPINSSRSVGATKRTKTDSLSFLDPIESTKTTKQLIRLLQFLKKQKSNFLHIVVNNKQHLDLLNTFFETSKINVPILIKESLPTNILPINTLQMLMFLNEPINNKETIFKRLFDKNIFLVNKINSKLEKNNWGTYKIFNELNDFKKIIFLLIVIHQTLNIK
jgi:hypothetical protein